MEYTLEQSEAYELAMLYRNIIGLENASNEEFFKAVQAKDDFVSKLSKD